VTGEKNSAGDFYFLKSAALSFLSTAVPDATITGSFKGFKRALEKV
jgi:hypothetical protein